MRPLLVCLMSVGAAFIAKLADDTLLAEFVPEIASASIETLLSVMSGSMLVVATFSVASMVSAYASASSTATPRSFGLVIADDVSKNALSTFVGAFIFSIVALVAVKNTYFDKAGLFILFVLTSTVFAIVIFTFVRWVDSIARLGRLGSTVDKVEQATASALKKRQKLIRLHCVLQDQPRERGQAVFAQAVGYVQHIDLSALQSWAQECDAQIEIAALPGTLATPDRVLAFVNMASGKLPEDEAGSVIKAFQLGKARLFEDDPRFGLVVLSEIASRALSPAVNDSGTAINVIGVLLRLLVEWDAPLEAGDEDKCKYDRVAMPLISVRDMLDDGFTSIARDGAAAVEVCVRLQKAFSTLAAVGQPDMQEAAVHYGQLALQRACKALDADEDIEAVRSAVSYNEGLRCQQ